MNLGLHLVVLTFSKVCYCVKSCFYIIYFSFLLPYFRVFICIFVIFDIFDIKGHLPPKCVFCLRLSSVEGRLLSEVVVCPRLSSIKSFLLLKIVFLQRSSSVKVCLPSKIVFRWRSSSAGGRLSPEIIFRPADPKLPPSYPWSESSKSAWLLRQINICCKQLNLFLTNALMNKAIPRARLPLLKSKRNTGIFWLKSGIFLCFSSF